MKPNLKSLLAMAMMASVLILSSCGKDDDAVTKSKTDLLTQNTWKYKEVTGVDAFSAAFINGLYSGSEYKFNADKTYTSVLFTLSGSGTWEFADNETKVILDGDAEETYTIVTLDDGTLSWKDADNATYVYNKK